MNSIETSVWIDTQEKLKRFVFRQTRDHALTDDIVHDVFLKVHAKLGQLKEADKITSWIFQIARNTITDHFRRQSRPLYLDEVGEVTNEQSLKECVVSCLQDMMTTLPVKYREALEMTEIGNLSQLQLAETLQISYSGAKSRVQRARQMLKERMDESYRIKFDRYGNVVVCEDKQSCCEQ